MTETGEQDTDCNKEGQLNIVIDEIFRKFREADRFRREVSSSGDLKNYTHYLLLIVMSCVKFL